MRGLFLRLLIPLPARSFWDFSTESTERLAPKPQHLQEPVPRPPEPRRLRDFDACGILLSLEGLQVDLDAGILPPAQRVRQVRLRRFGSHLDDNGSGDPERQEEIRRRKVRGEADRSVVKPTSLGQPPADPPVRIQE